MYTNASPVASQEVSTQAADKISSIDQFRKPAVPQPSGRTFAPRVGELIRALSERFRTASDGLLFIDHAQHDIRSSIYSGSTIEGTLTFKHGLLLQGESASPDGTLKAADSVVIIDEGALIEVNIECASLIVLGKYKGNAKVTGLLVNYGSIEGEFEYGGLESAGEITGRISRRRA